MQYAIHRAEGFVMVTGKPGTGKTTLVNDLVEGLSQSKIVVATIVSTQLEADDLLRLVACNFGLDVDAPNKAVVLQGLSVRLRRYHEDGTRALLIIDEAQDLSASALEELRLLTNLQLNNQPLLQIFLVGQENLRDLVQKPSMEQVHQRLVAACHLESLSEQDTKAYIKHRLDRVGWKDDPTIDEGVYPVVFQFSKGVPRRINLICSRFLLHGCVEEKHRIRAVDVRTVVEELQVEQLAPAGFVAELPPLMDDEESESQAVTEANGQQDDASTFEPAMDQSVDGADASVQKEEATPDDPDSEVSTNPTTSNITNLCSLEEQVKREEVHSHNQIDDFDHDVIQENYFSLSEVADPPSEPIPLRKREEAESAERGYGDRFANAQRQKETKAGRRTHYYSEYQAGANSTVVSGKKWSLWSMMLLFLLVVAAVAVAIYAIRPSMFSDSFFNVEPKAMSDLGGSGSEPKPGRLQTSPVNPEPANSGRLDAEPGSVTPDETAQIMTVTPGNETPSDQISSGAGQAEMPATELPAEAQKKTALEIEFSDNSSATAPSDGGHTLDNAEQPGLTGVEADTSPLIDTQARGRAPVDDSATAAQPISDIRNKEAIADADLPEVDRPAVPVVDGSLTVESTVSIPSEETAVAGAITSAAISTQVEGKKKSGRQSQLESLALQRNYPQGTDKAGGSVREPPLLVEDAGPAVPRDLQSVMKTKILFGSDSAVIADVYDSTLSEIVEWLKRNARHSAYITGYADSRGDTVYNQKLSLNRAKAVAAYLEKKNIANTRLHVEGRGVYPVKDTPSNEGITTRQSQRMVEVIVRPGGN